MKMKKLLLVPLVAMALGACSSSGGTDDSGDDFDPDEISNPDTSVTGDLDIRMFRRGFGDKWITNVRKSFMKKYPNVNVNISSATDPLTIYGEIIGGKADYDLFLTESSIMDQTDKFLCINDIYESLVTDGTQKINERLDESFTQSCSNKNGDFYTIPGYCGAYGFVYNRSYLEGKNIPVTTNELVALCNSLKNENIRPLVMSGGDSSHYLDFLFSTFASQYEGREAYLKAQVGRVYDSSTGTYEKSLTSAYLPGHVKSSEVLESLYWLDNGFISNQDTSFSAANAQLRLINPSYKTAMMFNGSWFATETQNKMKAYEVKPDDYGMFKAPIISSIIEKCTSISDDEELSALIKAIDSGATSLSGNGYEVNQEDFNKIKEARSFVYIGSEESRFVITKIANDPELAKLFLKFYYSDYGIKAFNASKAGCYLPFKASTVEVEGMNLFLKDVYTILAENSKFFNLVSAQRAISPFLYSSDAEIGNSFETAFGSIDASDRRNTQKMLEDKMRVWNQEKYDAEMTRKGY